MHNRRSQRLSNKNESNLTRNEFLSEMHDSQLTNSKAILLDLRGNPVQLNPFYSCESSDYKRRKMKNRGMGSAIKIDSTRGGKRGRGGNFGSGRFVGKTRGIATGGANGNSSSSTPAANDQSVPPVSTEEHVYSATWSAPLISTVQSFISLAEIELTPAHNNAGVCGLENVVAACDETDIRFPKEKRTVSSRSDTASGSASSSRSQSPVRSRSNSNSAPGTTKKMRKDLGPTSINHIHESIANQPCQNSVLFGDAQEKISGEYDPESTNAAKPDPTSNADDETRLNEKDHPPTSSDTAGLVDTESNTAHGSINDPNDVPPGISCADSSSVGQTGTDYQDCAALIEISSSGSEGADSTPSRGKSQEEIENETLYAGFVPPNAHILSATILPSTEVNIESPPWINQITQLILVSVKEELTKITRQCIKDAVESLMKEGVHEPGPSTRHKNKSVNGEHSSKKQKNNTALDSLRDRDGRSQFVCKECDKDCINQAGLSTHRKFKHKTNPVFECPTCCVATFQFKCDLKEHEKRCK